jgi:hypothetical protein
LQSSNLVRFARWLVPVVLSAAAAGAYFLELAPDAGQSAPVSAPPSFLTGAAPKRGSYVELSKAEAERLAALYMKPNEALRLPPMRGAMGPAADALFALYMETSTDTQGRSKEVAKAFVLMPTAGAPGGYQRMPIRDPGTPAQAEAELSWTTLSDVPTVAFANEDSDPDIELEIRTACEVGAGPNAAEDQWTDYTVDWNGHAFVVTASEGEEILGGDEEEEEVAEEPPAEAAKAPEARVMAREAECDTGVLRVLIDQLEGGTLRYQSWRKEPASDHPELELTGGTRTVSPDANPCLTRTFTFQTKRAQFTLRERCPTAESPSRATLTVVRDGKTIGDWACIAP